MNAGAYLDNAYITKWAHDCGIKVVELQHGMTTLSSVSYIQSDYANSNKSLSLYPDYILTWGAFLESLFSITV